MASTYESAAVQKILKDKYGDYEDNVPNFAICRQRMKLKPSQKIGKKFIAAVGLQVPHGHTYNGSSSTLGTAFALNDSNAGITEQAEVYGTEYVNRDYIPYTFITKSDNGEASAFEQGFEHVLRQLNTSTNFALEELTLYGGRWIGEVSGAGQGDSAPANSGANDLVIFVTKREWAAGLWSLRIGSFVDVYSAVGTWPSVTPTTLRNATGTVKVTGVDSALRKLTLTFSVAGERAGVVETDVIMPKGTLNNWSAGIAQAGYLSGAGSALYGITSSTYPMFQATLKSQSSTGTFAKLTQVAAGMTAKGGLRDYSVLCSPWLFNDINNDQASLRQYTNDYGGKFENGANGARDNSLRYYGPNGSIEIVSHPMVKAGEAILIDFSIWSYIGSTLPTFKIPGSPEWFLQQMPDNAGVQIRQMFDLAPFTPNPAAIGIAYGFTPGGLT